MSKIQIPQKGKMEMQTPYRKCLNATKKEQEIIYSKEFIYRDGDPRHTILSLLVLSDPLRQVGVVGQAIEERRHLGPSVHLFLWCEREKKGEETENAND